MTRRRSLVPSVVAISIGVALTAPAHAQSAGSGFLFRAPQATLTLRGGFDRANAGGDVFSHATEHLTLDRHDFSGPTLMGELGIRLTPRIDLVLDGGYSGTEAGSEFRAFVEEDEDTGKDKPIEQTTRFERAPLTAGLKAYLTPRGRSIGQFAWVPAKIAPYMGAGAGGMWYRFHQAGDFVNFETAEIFTAESSSSGWTATAHGTAGLDFSLTPRLAVTTEARYTWARAEPSGDFDGSGLPESERFGPIDLSGLSAMIGFNVRF